MKVVGPVTVILWLVAGVVASWADHALSPRIITSLCFAACLFAALFVALGELKEHLARKDGDARVEAERFRTTTYAMQLVRAAATQADTPAEALRTLKIAQALGRFAEDPTAAIEPPCTCKPGEPFHRRTCPRFDPVTDPADYEPPRGDPITAARQQYRERDTEDL